MCNKGKILLLNNTNHKNMTLLIREKDVKKILTFEDTIEAVENAYRQYGMGLAGWNSLKYRKLPPPRCEIRVEGKELPHISPKIRGVNQSMAYLEGTGMIFLRWSFHLGDKAGNMAYLIDASNGEILAIIKAPGYEGWIRTGTAGAVAAKYLSREDSRIAGVLGTGRQGRAQLQILSKVRNIEKAYAYSGRRRDEKYAKEMGEKLGIDVIASNGAEEVVRNADILITTTLSTTPIVRGEWIDEGLHINAIGADDPIKVELDANTLKRADKIVIDDYELALDTKELRVPLEKGILSEEDIYGTIGEVVAGIKQGRETQSEITIFESTGMTMPYVTINEKVYEKAKKMGLGEDIGEAFTDLIYA
jgi:ornithine cyclodeaminase/alanine dehydrogenase-like protein (mu-crystallin family)